MRASHQKLVLAWHNPQGKWQPHCVVHREEVIKSRRTQPNYTIPFPMMLHHKTLLHDVISLGCAGSTKGVKLGEQHGSNTLLLLYSRTVPRDGHQLKIVYGAETVMLAKSVSSCLKDSRCWWAILWWWCPWWETNLSKEVMGVVSQAHR